METRIVGLLVDAAERALTQALQSLDDAGFTGLSVSHAYAVQAIAAGVATITALSAVMRMTPQAVSAIVDQLEARGLVVRRRREGDARAKVLTLTDEGWRLAMHVGRALGDVERTWLEVVGPGQLKAVTKALAEFVSAGADPSSASGRPRRRRVRIT